MSVLEAILIATNAVTVNLLVLSVRSARRWRQAQADADRYISRYESKQETAKIRSDNGGW